METIIMKISDIHPAEYNPRVMLKPGDAEYESLKNSLDNFGIATPLIFNRKTGTLVSGHQRLNVLKQMGVVETEVVLVEVEADKEKLLNIALNKIDGEWDYTKLEEVFSEFSDDDIQSTGYTTEELDSLFGTEAIKPKYNFENDSDDEESELNEKAEKPEKEFNIFFSFPTKEAAEKWLKDKGQEYKFEGTSHNITIRMEGADFGTRN